MKIPIRLRSIYYLYYIVDHDGIKKRFWLYKSALKFQENITSKSENVNFMGYDLIKGCWISFFIKWSPISTMSLSSEASDELSDSSDSLAETTSLTSSCLNCEHLLNTFKNYKILKELKDDLKGV